jgi:hypothetical protein
MSNEELLPTTVSGRKILADIDELREWFEGHLGKTRSEWIAEIRATEAEALADITARLEASERYGKVTYGVEQELRREVTDQQASFDLRWKADMRAIAAWQAKTGRLGIWPDHVDLVLWLLEQREAQNAQMTALLPRLSHDPNCRVSRYHHPMAADLPQSECNCYLADLLSATEN